MVKMSKKLSVAVENYNKKILRGETLTAVEEAVNAAIIWDNIDLAEKIVKEIYIN